MKEIKTTAVILILFLLAVSKAGSQVAGNRNWPSYRGLNASGVLDNASLPDTFNVSTMYNIRWKTKVPGLGLSSPVIWGNRLFITTAIGKSGESGLKTGLYGDITPVMDSTEHEWKVLCYDRNTGKLIWEQTACTGIPAIKRHPKSTHANTTVATDGRFVVAFFGSEGLYCYDIDGNLKWKKSFGKLRSVFFASPGAEWEFASSPVIHAGKLVIQCDVLENPFLAAFELSSGKELWRTKRDDYPAWSTPGIYENAGKTCIAVNGFRHMGGYDLGTGSEIWKMSGGGDIPIPTPVMGEGLIYLNGAHGKMSPIIAVRKSATGDISLKEGETSNQHVQWSRPRGGSYMHTLLLYRNKLYNVGWNGTVNCIDPNTGIDIYSGKLGKTRSFVASPVASDGKIYIVDEQGTVFIIDDGPSLNVLREIPLGENCLTAPSISDGAIYFRTQGHLIAAGKK